MGHRAGARHRQGRRPADRAGFRIERAQAHQRVDHDHLGPCLEHFEGGRRRGHAHQTLHEAAEAAAFRLGLLEERFTHPALGAGRQIVERDHGRTRGALAVDQQRSGLWQHAACYDAGQSQAPRVEEHGAGHGVEDEREAGLRRFHQE